MQISQLDRAARGRLRTLSKETAEVVGRHLVMAGRLIDSDPELAYEHAQAAVRRAGRVDVAREAAGLTAYATGRYAEALRELRTVRRLNGSSEHLPIMADCERGLGRPERALALAVSEEAATLDDVGRTELAIVVSGARVDLGELDAALAALEQVPAVGNRGELGARVLQARAAVLEVAGRTEEAAEILAGIDANLLTAVLGEDDEDVVVYDLTDELDEDGDPVAEPDEQAESATTDAHGPAEDQEAGGASGGTRAAVVPDDTAPDDTAPDDTAPDDTAPDDTAPDDTAPDDTAPDDTAPDDTAPDDTAPDDAAVESQDAAGSDSASSDEGDR